MKKILALLAFAALGAQAASTTDTTWQYTPYSSEVTDLKVFPGATRVIWIGTKHGVVRIKGTDTLRFNSRNSSLPSDIIYPANSNYVTGQLTPTALDSAGSYWIAYNQLHTLVRIDTRGAITVFSSPTTTTPWGFTVGITASASRLYVGDSLGNIYYTADPTATSPTWSSLNMISNGGRLNTLAMGWNDTLWLGYTGGTYGNLMYKIGTTQGAFKIKGTTVFSSEVYGIWFTDLADSVKYINTATLNDNSWTELNDDSLFAISADGTLDTIKRGSGDIGIHTVGFPNPKGFPYFLRGDTVFQAYTSRGILGLTKLNILAGTNCGAFLGDSILIGSSNVNGLYLNHNTGIWDTTPYEPVIKDSIVAAAHGTSGSLWIANSSGIYSRSDADTTLSKVYTPSSGKVRTIARDSTGLLWIGQSNGLVTLNGTTKSAILSNISTDSVLNIASNSKYTWILHKSAAGTVALHEVVGGTSGTWTQIALTDLSTLSDSITEIRASNDGVLWILANGKIYNFTGSSWTKWAGIDPTRGGVSPSRKFLHFDLASNNVWATYLAGLNVRWGVSGVSDSKQIDSGSAGSYSTNPLVLAESDTSAWYFRSPIGEANANGTSSAAQLFRVNTNSVGTTASYSSDTVSALHQAAINSGNLLSDGNGGVWLVETEGVSRLKVTTIATGISGHAKAAVGTASAAIRDGKLTISIASAATVRVQTLDMNGRVLDDRDLGALSAGSHSVGAVQGHGMLLVRVWTDGISRSIRLPTL
jgi:hypothetical protein